MSSSFQNSTTLAIRRVRRKFNAVVFYVLNKIKDDPISFVLALVGLWLAYQANNISTAAYTLSKNDKSQQDQIDSLTSIIKRIDKSNEISESQTEILISQNKELINISKSEQNQNTLGNKLLSQATTQLYLTNKQVSQSNKNDSISSTTTALNNLANFYDFISITKKVLNRNYLKLLRTLPNMTFKQRSSFINNLFDVLIEGLKCKYVVTNPRLANIFLQHERNLRFVMSDIDTFNIASQFYKMDSSIYIDDCNRIVNLHLIFNYRVGKEIEKSEKELYDKVFRLTKDSTVIKGNPIYRPFTNE